MKSTGEISIAPPLAGFWEFSTRDRREQASRRSFSIGSSEKRDRLAPYVTFRLPGERGAGPWHDSVESARFDGLLEVLRDPAATV